MRSLFWLALMSTIAGCAVIADLREDPGLVETGGAEGGAGAGGDGGQVPDAGGGGGAAGCSEANLGMSDLCSGGKCTVVDSGSGAVGCAPGGTLGVFQGCETDDHCEDGTFCDLDWKTCKRFCTSDVDCSGGAGKCLAATEAGRPLPFKICAAQCDPVAGTRCDVGSACFLRDTTMPIPIWDCGGSNGWIFGQPGCDSGRRDCANTLTCEQGECRRFCYTADPAPLECSGSCGNAAPGAVFGGKPVGSCN